MKKYLKLIFISILVFSVCGCSNKDLLSQTEEMSNVIIKLYQDIYYDYSKLPKESIKIINDLKDYEESNENDVLIITGRGDQKHYYDGKKYLNFTDIEYLQNLGGQQNE